MKKFIAEFIGTFTLVFFAVGTAVVAGEQVGVLGIALAFGFALIAMAYGIGPISGCHINPAVSLGVFFAGRMPANELIGYVVAQCLGGIVGAAMLTVLVGGHLGGYDIVATGLGQNGWGPGYLGEYTLGSAIIFEFVATFLFLVTILGATQAGAPTQIAGLAIGICLAVIHIFGIQITGVSVNPARSLGPALMVGGNALGQVWMFLIVPSLAGIVAGLLFRNGLLEADR
jgi:aquaporin Z